jgi:hypothetical protein
MAVSINAMQHWELFINTLDQPGMGTKKFGSFLLKRPF